MERKIGSPRSYVSLVFFLFCQIIEASVLTPQEIAMRALDSTVLLVMEDTNGQPLGVGSGFFVQPNQIATNYHVIDGAVAGTAKRVKEGVVYTVEGLVAIDEKHDLAILQVSDAHVRPLPLADSDTVVIGDTCYVVGNPKGFLEGTFSQGIISSVRFKGMRKLLQITAPISSGNSGGPVLNNKCEVIGVAVAQIKDGQNLNFAIPSNSLTSITSYREGNAKYLQGLYHIAISNYDISIRLNPENGLAYTWRGISRYELGQDTAARRDCYTARELMRRMQNQETTGSTKKILKPLVNEIVEYDVAIQKNPENALAHFWRGFANNGMAKFNAAIADFNTAVRLLPDFALAYDSRGIAKYHLGQYRESIADYDTATRLKPDFAEAYGNRAIARERLGQLGEAISDYDVLLQIKPDYARAYVHRGIAKDAIGQRNAALADYQAAIRLQQDYAEVLASQGFAKIITGQYSSGIRDYNTVMRLQQARAETFRNSGVTKTSLGPYSLLITDLDKEIQRNPYFAEAWAGRAWAKAKLNDNHDAIEDCDIAIRLKPNFARAHYNRGLAKQNLGRTWSAKRDFQTALRLAEQTGNKRLKANLESAMRELD